MVPPGWDLQRVKSRCVIDGQHWLWDGATTIDGYPLVSVADASRKNGKRLVHVRRIVYELHHGEEAPPPPRHVLVPRCRCKKCVSPYCLEVLSKAARIREAVATGVFRTPKHRAAIAAGRARHPQAAVDHIRAGPESVPELAKLYGISLGHAYAIRQGVHRIDWSSPFAALRPPPARRS